MNEGRTDNQSRVVDGAAYERMMGVWSRLAGDVFLDWLAPRPGLRWIDVGCGTGAFSELLIERCAPAEVQGIDPSEAQLAFARTRPAARLAQFRQGDAIKTARDQQPCCRRFHFNVAERNTGSTRTARDGDLTKAQVACHSKDLTI